MKTLFVGNYFFKNYVALSFIEWYSFLWKTFFDWIVLAVYIWCMKLFPKIFLKISNVLLMLVFFSHWFNVLKNMFSTKTSIQLVTNFVFSLNLIINSLYTFAYSYQKYFSDWILHSLLWNIVETLARVNFIKIWEAILQFLVSGLRFFAVESIFKIFLCMRFQGTVNQKKLYLFLKVHWSNIMKWKTNKQMIY